MPPLTRRESRIIKTLKGHRHFIIVISLLLLVMTFPTILLLFKTDAFALPTGDSYDIFIHIWDVWYWKQILSGLADRAYTNTMFYPHGLSLVHHPLSSMPINTLQIALQRFMPVSNAFNLVFLLVIYLNAIGAYVYALWLFKDKRIALLSAAVFALSPHILGQPNQLHDATLVTLPLAVYCFHRGTVERRERLIVAAGLLTGLTSTITLYSFSCLLIMLAAGIFALAVSRWRDRRYWANIALLALTIALSSVWVIYPMMADAQSLDSALGWHGKELRNDLISSFINHNNPVLGPALEYFFQTPADIQLSTTSYIGFVPGLLACFGIFSRASRRQALPWLALAAVFFVLRLGSTLHVNGAVYSEILLPKHYLDKILPSIFEAFSATHRFQIGFLLPLAVLAGYGFIALRKLRPIVDRPWVIALLFAFLALEYYVPTVEKSFPFDRFAYIEWLDQEDEREIRLVHLPFGRINSKQYMLFQSLSGYPHAEGAISRTPESAYDYIKANPVLSIWNNLQPTNCNIQNQDAYLAGIQQLIADGFSHIVHHNDRYHWQRYIESFRYLDPAYRDDHVSIYRMSDLRDSCPEDFLARHPVARDYVDALRQLSVIDNRHGTALLFPPSPEAGDQIRQYMRHFAQSDRAVATIASDEQGRIKMQNSEILDADAGYNLESEAAVWLVNELGQFDAAQTSAYREWFAPRFNFCARYYEDGMSTIDLYLRKGIPCTAMDESSAFAVQYDNGIRLRNASYEINANLLRFFLAWEKDPAIEYGFSLQFYNDGGQKVHQYDHVIGRSLLAVHEFDVSPLREGAYSVRLIVYDFETHETHSGTVSATSERFDREFEVARIEG
ncbi:MAG: hypothetical protein OXI77_10010 [Chloroflexota bacterium]|nr:hypothetical protein [Chloroflexota bacterium]MDE2909210.1 hypothetical protein [Chloroflexota bacterium]